MTTENSVDHRQPFAKIGHVCPKCDGDEIRWAHHADRERHSDYDCSLVNLLVTSFPPEHICLTCRRCGFRWPMKVAADV